MATNTREKGERRAQARDTRPKAHVRHVRLSPKKARLVLDLVRGRSVDEALAILQFTHSATSPVVIKLINSAIANAVNNQDLDRDSLYVAEIYANPGPTLKRFKPRARGSAAPFYRRTSHISVVLDQR